MVSNIFEAHEKLGVPPFKTHPGWSVTIQNERFFDVKTRPQPRTEVAEQGITRKTARDFHGGGGLLGYGVSQGDAGMGENRRLRGPADCGILQFSILFLRVSNFDPYPYPYLEFNFLYFTNWGVRWFQEDTLVGMIQKSQ
jgi:hypothetical protein